jgi:hypothetical protein
MLCICFSPRVHLSWILGQKHENNTTNADFWILFIEEKTPLSGPTPLVANEKNVHINLGHILHSCKIM